MIGILSLETRFPRIPGDVGNPATFDFPVAVRVVPGATPERVVARRAEGLLEAFVEAALELVEEGAAGIVTTCGFLVLMQAELQARVPVPVATSALLQIPLVQRLLPPGRTVGVVTVAASSLAPAHLEAAGATPDTPVEGVSPDGEFARVFLGNAPDLDVAAVEREVVEASRRLVARESRVGALVLECTNMGPYASAVREATGLPVHDIVSLVGWFRAGLAPASFPR